MSDEIKVSIQPDQGIKNQWARGLFYRNDGLKRTLVSKHLTYLTVGGFCAVAIALLMQGSPEESAPRGKPLSESLPVPSGENEIKNIPAAAVVDSSEREQKPKEVRSGSGNSSATKVKFTGPMVVSRPRSGKIPPGSFLKAVLLTGASNGSVRAEVTEPLEVNGETLIEQGAVLLGTGQSGEDRLSIRFSQVVYKDGAFSSIDAQACDVSDKITGLKGSQVGNQALKLAGGIGLNFAGALSGALVDTQGQNGAVIQSPTLKNALLTGAGTAAIDQSKEMMNDLRNRQPVIEVPQGTPIYVLFQSN